MKPLASCVDMIMISVRMTYVVVAFNMHVCVRVVCISMSVPYGCTPRVRPLRSFQQRLPFLAAPALVCLAEMCRAVVANTPVRHPRSHGIQQLQSCAHYTAPSGSTHTYLPESAKHWPLYRELEYSHGVTNGTNPIHENWRSIMRQRAY